MRERDGRPKYRQKRMKAVGERRREGRKAGKMEEKTEERIEGKGGWTDGGKGGIVSDRMADGGAEARMDGITDGRMLNGGDARLE